jgi:hypothetical protein
VSYATGGRGSDHLSFMFSQRNRPHSSADGPGAAETLKELVGMMRVSLRSCVGSISSHGRRAGEPLTTGSSDALSLYRLDMAILRL